MYVQTCEKVAVTIKVENNCQSVAGIFKFLDYVTRRNRKQLDQEKMRGHGGRLQSRPWDMSIPLKLF